MYTNALSACTTENQKEASDFTAGCESPCEY